MKPRTFFRSFGYQTAGLVGLWMAAFPNFAPAQRPIELPAVRIVADVPYVDRDERDGMRVLDWYIPQPEKKKAAVQKKYPVVVFLHGGAWAAGDKSSWVERLPLFAARLADHGILVANVNYRLAPGFKHPTQIKDVAMATAFVKKTAESYGGDPERLFLCGHSAGGHLAALLATHPDYAKAAGLEKGSIKGVVGISGVYAFGGFSRLVGQVFFKGKNDHVDASPVEHVDGDDPPFLIFSAEHDLFGQTRQAKTLHAALDKAGVSAEVFEITTTNHVSMMHRCADPEHAAHRMIVQFFAQKPAERKAEPPHPDPTPPPKSKSKI